MTESREFLIYDKNCDNKILNLQLIGYRKVLPSIFFFKFTLFKLNFEGNSFTHVHAFLPNRLQKTYIVIQSNVILVSIMKTNWLQD